MPVIPINYMVPVAVMAFAFLAWILVRLIRLTRRGEDWQAMVLALRVGLLWAAGLLLVTLGGRARDLSGGVFFNWVPFGAQSVVSRPEVVLNALLFAPAGLLLPWIVRSGLWLRMLIALVGAGVVSLVIEVVQAFTPLGTAGDITDIMLNTLGAVVGAVVGSLAWKLSRASVRKNHEIRSDPAGRVGR